MFNNVLLDNFMLSFNYIVKVLLFERENMSKYQIVEVGNKKKYNALSKAPSDVVKIANSDGFASKILKVKVTPDRNIFEKIIKQIIYVFKWQRMYSAFNDGDVLLLQYPSYHYQFNQYRILAKLRQNKNMRLIFVIHDIDQLRTNSKDRTFDQMVSVADKLILHNKQMIKYMEGLGVNLDKMINLQIFDYLLPDYDQVKPSKFDRSVIIAGNLDSNKAGYIKDLDKINVKFDLYGAGYKASNSSNIFYHGALSPDKVPYSLNKGFGLVWDGDSIDSCTGLVGNYLRYNNPHKLSLYIASKLPVIIWSGAAEADFVKKFNIGYTINSLTELPDLLKQIDKQKYDQLLKNVVNVGKKVTSGQFMCEALEQALK